MTNRLELNWKVDGFIDEQRYYCSETPIDPENLPLPKAVLAGEARSHTDTNIEIGKTYYIRIGSVKNGVEKLSSEINVSAGIPWTPEEITTSMYFTADSVIKDGLNRISQLNDLSGNGNHAIQNTDSRKPLHALFGGGSLAIQFDGIDDYLWQSNTSYLNNVAGAWVFSIELVNSKSGYTYLTTSPFSISGASKIASGYLSSKPYIGGRRQYSNAWSEVVDTLNRTGEENINFSQIDFSSAKALMFINGTQTAINNSFGTAGNADNTAIVGTSIGAYVGNNNASAFAGGVVGKVGCIIIGTGVLSAVNRQKLEGWAAHKYGLTGNLPSGHPYKTLIPTL